jgi:hypothetical protein
VIYQATDNGILANINFSRAASTDNLNWHLNLGNYYRNAFWQEKLVNIYAGTKEIFIKAENYAFPNPWVARHHASLKFNVMTSIDTEVEINIYNISGQLLSRVSESFIAFEGNRDKFVFDPKSWAPGIYFAVLEANGEKVNVKFGIQK